MGFAKAQMMQEDEQGWSFTSQSVCRDCVDDYALKDAIGADETPDLVCDFCSDSPAAPLDTLLQVFVRGLHNEYEDAIDGVGWDGREGGYQWSPTWDTWDLINDFDSVLTGDGLLDAVRAAVHDRTWVELNFAWRRRDEVLVESWERFCQAVQYETRYVLWLREDPNADEEVRHTGEVPPARILDEVGSLIDRLELVRRLPPRYKTWRAQEHADPMIDHTPSRLGTVPRDKAKRANRMSPAGIPMFYGANDVLTAVREVAFLSANQYATWCAFETSQASTVIDFTGLPPVPSMFDPELGGIRRLLIFLHRFVKQLSDRIRPDFEQIDYVPTQIVTEYLLKIYGGGGAVDGLLYPSSLTGEVCAVFDVPNGRCVEQGPGWADGGELRLGLAPGTIGSRALVAGDSAGVP